MFCSLPIAAGLAVAASLLNCNVALALEGEAVTSGNSANIYMISIRILIIAKKELRISRNSNYEVYECGAELKIIY